MWGSREVMRGSRGSWLVVRRREWKRCLERFINENSFDRFIKNSNFRGIGYFCDI